jgi:hypothetical protein
MHGSTKLSLVKAGGSQGNGIAEQEPRIANMLEMLYRTKACQTV